MPWLAKPVGSTIMGCASGPREEELLSTIARVGTDDEEEFAERAGESSALVKSAIACGAYPASPPPEIVTGLGEHLPEDVALAVVGPAAKSGSGMAMRKGV
jgi:hypothetical protein